MKLGFIQAVTVAAMVGCAGCAGEVVADADEVSATASEALQEEASRIWNFCGGGCFSASAPGERIALALHGIDGNPATQFRMPDRAGEIRSQAVAGQCIDLDVDGATPLLRSCGAPRARWSYNGTEGLKDLATGLCMMPRRQGNAFALTMAPCNARKGFITRTVAR